MSPFPALRRRKKRIIFCAAAALLASSHTMPVLHAVTSHALMGALYLTSGMNVPYATFHRSPPLVAHRLDNTALGYHLVAFVHQDMSIFCIPGPSEEREVPQQHWACHTATTRDKKKQKGPVLI